MIPSALPPKPAAPAPAAPPAMEAPGSMREVCIPLANLATEGQDKTDVAPEPGDPVDFQATGTVSRVEGDSAYLTLETVNGEPLPAEAAPDQSADPTESDMLAMAAKADDQPSSDY